MKQIIRLIIVMFVFLNSTNSLYSQKCKYYVDESDPITGEEHKAINTLVKIAHPFNFSQIGGWGIDFDRIGDKYSIISRLVIENDINEQIQRGDSLLIKLDSGKIITLYSNSAVSPKSLNDPNEKAKKNYISTYPISKDDFALLCTNEIVFLRINVSQVVFDLEVEGKQIKKLQEAAKCIFK